MAAYVAMANIVMASVGSTRWLTGLIPDRLYSPLPMAFTGDLSSKSSLRA